jgi:SecD/SecF fusion protein
MNCARDGWTAAGRTKTNPAQRMLHEMRTMSGKYLSIKFLIVAVVVALCLGSVFLGPGLRYGPDIAGGYSMIFEVRVDEQDTGNVVEEIIAILKKRIDPAGLSSLEWTPLKNNRFEIRMPAASEDSQALREEYLDARDALLATNITRADVRSLARLDPAQRPAAIKTLTGGDAAQAAALSELLIALDTLSQTEQARAALVSTIASADDDQLEELQQRKIDSDQAVAAARANYARAWQAVQGHNVNPNELLGTLKILDEIRQAETDDARNADRKRFEDNLAELIAAHPARQELIETVAERYQAWVEIRRPLESPNDLKRLIRKAGVLEFRIAPYNPQLISNAELTNADLTPARIQELKADLEELGPEGALDPTREYIWCPILGEVDGYGNCVTHDYAGQRYLLLSNQPGQKMVQAGEDGRKWTPSARPDQDNFGAPAVGFELDPAGGRLMSQMTANNREKRMAILLDQEVYSAPTIQATISTRGIITGKFTAQEVIELARTIDAGRLPGKVNDEPVSESVFGAAIGEVNLQKGIRAAVIGLIAVAVFMVIYYLLCGAIADVALLLNLILVLGAMSLFRATLTLPGIAGVILTIGMAVDANVLIFERLREEQARGLAVGQALKNAYERAFTAIFDANITTLLICLFLFVVFGRVGMEEVRGFAVTLGLGVIFSMFTALVLTRWVFQVLLQLKILRNPLPMLRLVGIYKINWINKRYAFWVISIILVVTGIGSLAWQGKNILGIEFSSGTQAQLKLRDDALIDGQLPNDALVREAFAAASAGNDKLLNARVESIFNENRVEQFLELYGNEKGEVTQASWTERDKNPEYFKLLDADGNGILSEAELETRLPKSPTSYQISTTESRPQVVRDTANEAFGTSLQRRLPVKFQLVTGQAVPALNLTPNAEGVAWLEPGTVGGVPTALREDMEDFADGVVMVIDQLDPAITAEDLETRIRDIRLQPDFGQAAINPYRVIGLTPAVNGKGYTSLAVLARPANPDLLKNDAGKELFASMETDVLTEALRREEAMVLISFDPAIAEQIAQLAIVVVILSWLAIVAYLWLRFGSVRWGLAAVICLVHDVIIVVGLVAATGWLYNTVVGEALGLGSFKIDRAMVAALLTVIGYSVNDTIVVFDRIRENRGKLSTVSGQVINDSINQTLPRTLLTSFTTLLVVFIMYVWGGEGIHSFSFALLMGVLFGTYSSIAIASPMLLGFKKALVHRVTDPVEEQTASS